jgi:hypothetical protein
MANENEENAIIIEAREIARNTPAVFVCSCKGGR